MADTLKVLGQAYPNTATLTDAYTVPGATSDTISSIVVCNQAKSGTVFRISVAVAGAADEPKQYLYYDTPIGPNSTFVATIGGTLAAGAVIRVYSLNGMVSFNIFGVEVT